jgi:hypothetical protein
MAGYLGQKPSSYKAPGYIGNEPNTTGHFPVDNLTSSGGSTYTLSFTPASAGAIEVSVQGVLQPTTAYTVNGTTLTMAGVTSGVKIFVRHLGETLDLPTPADGSVTTAKLATNSVDGTKIAMGSDAAGDILYHGASDYARLAKGTAGQALVMNSGATAPEWGEAGGGKILQVVAVSLLTEVTTSSATYVAITGMTADITPSATTSKILIMIQGTISHTGDGYGHSVRLYRDSTNIANGSGGSGRENCLTNHESSSTGGRRRSTALATMWVDSPSSTSSVTYSLKHRTSGATAVFGAGGSSGSINYGQRSSHITLLEIGV